MFSWEITFLFDVCMMLLFIPLRSQKNTYKWIPLFLFSYFIFIIWLYFYSESLNSYDKGVINSNVVMFGFMLSIWIVCKRIRIRESVFLDILSIVLLLQPIIILLQFFIPPLREIMAAFIGYEGDHSEVSDLNLRMLGFTKSYDTSAILAVASTLIWSFRVSICINLKNEICLITSIISCFLTSRTGIVLAFCIIAFIIVPIIYKNSRIKIIFSIIIVFVIIISFSTMVYYIGEIVNVVNDPIGYRMTSSNDNYTSGSLNVLLTTHWEPLMDGFHNLKLGTLQRADDNIHSDIGYVKTIYETGIISLIFFTSYYCISFYSLLSNYKNRNMIQKRLIKNTLGLILLVFLFSFKNRFMFNIGGIHLLITIVTFYLLTSSQSNANYGL